MSDEIIDAKGREYTTAVRNELKGDLASLAARVRALETRPPPATGGLTRDEIWKLAGDRIFAELTTSGTPLFAAVMSSLLLGETPQGYHGLAFALIVAGIAVSSRRG